MATAMTVGAPQPSPPPPLPSSDANKSIRDCTFGICTPNCRQYCFLYPQPPPSQQQQLPFINNPDDSATDDSSSHTISPLMAALIAVLAAAFLLLFYYTVVSRLCRRRRSNHRRRLLQSIGSDTSNPRADALAHDPTRPDTGLDDTFIHQITVFKYKPGDGLVEGTECAVCLSDFSDGESLRLMPNCEHAFHIPCIDTWLQSHSNCPLCRSTMNPLPVRSGDTNSTTNNNNDSASVAGGGVSMAAMQVERGNDAVFVVREVESRGEVEVFVEAGVTDEDRRDGRDKESAPP